MSSALSALSLVLVAVSAQGTSGGASVVKMASNSPVAKQVQYQAGPAMAPAPAPAPMVHHGPAGPPMVSGDCGACSSHGACGHHSRHGHHKFSFWGYWGLPSHHCPPGNLHQHIPYIAYPKNYYYFRPYNYFHIPDQQQEVLTYGGDPRDPYANEVFKRVYDRVFDPALGPVPEFVPPVSQ